ncbi:MAG: hypothetical protein LUG45_04805 [Clostridiales bacterium]|nr:hypothetical protein [Clostridiales bacterium]
MKILIRKISPRVNAKDMAYFLAYFLLFTCDFYDTTTFKGLVDISPLLNLVRAFSAMLIVAKCVFLDRYSFKQLSLAIIIVVTAAISVLSSNTAMLFDYILLAVGCRGIDNKKIVKVYFNLGTLYLLITMFCSLTGIIDNYSTVRTGTETVRYSFGIIYSTDFAAHVFFLILAYHYIRKRKIKPIDILAHLLIVVFLDMYCNARLSEIMILFALVLFYLYDYREEFYQSRFFAIVTHWITLICGIFSIIVTYLYSGSSQLWIVLDELLFSNRLRVGKKVIDMYGFTLFGQYIKMQGNGYKIYDYDTSIGTTYIDSSYLQLIMIYGVVFFAIIMIAYTYCAKKVAMEKDGKLSIVIILIAVSSIMNQYLINIAYNPFVIILGVYLLSNRVFPLRQMGINRKALQ